MVALVLGKALVVALVVHMDSYRQKSRRRMEDRLQMRRLLQMIHRHMVDLRMNLQQRMVKHQQNYRHTVEQLDQNLLFLQWEHHMNLIHLEYRRRIRQARRR